jgi:hypothetical protein
LCILVLGWCSRRKGLPLASRRFAFAVLVAVVAALFNVYYAAMFVELLVLSAVLQAVRGAFKKTMAPLVLAVAVIGLFALESLGTLRYPALHGKNLDAVSRSYGDLEHYALKPLEMLLPPPYAGLVPYGRLAAGYWENARGEVGSAYLGLVAIVGLASLFGPLALSLVRGGRARLTPAMGSVLWVLAFSVVGGANGVLGSLGVVLLRGTNRYSIWIVAVALLHLVVRLSRAPRIRALPAAIVLGLVALVDQTPAPSAQNAAWQHAAVEKDRAFAERLETTLGGRGMVFMLPVLAFPEGGGVRQVNDYEHFRPYLFTKRLRYSYGTDKGRRREDWQWRVQAMTPARMVERLEDYGFSALVVDRRGYADGGKELILGLAAAGRPVAFDEEGEARALVRLNPRNPARLPDTAPVLGDGWYGRAQGGLSWSSATRAEWRLENPTASPLAVRLRFELTTARPRGVSLVQGDQVLGTWQPAPTAAVSDLAVVLPPGPSQLFLVAEGLPDIAEIGNRLRPTAFAVRDLEMREE